MPARSSSQAVRRAPWSSGRVSSTQTWREPAALPGRAQHAAGGAVAAGGQRAGVAVGERAVARREQLGARARRGAGRRASCSRVQLARAGERVGRPSTWSRAQAEVHRGRPRRRAAAPPRRPRSGRRAPARRPRRSRSPARRAPPACGCSPPPRPASRSAASAPRRAARAGRARAARRPRSAAARSCGRRARARPEAGAGRNVSGLLDESALLEVLARPPTRASSCRGRRGRSAPASPSSVRPLLT